MRQIVLLAGFVVLVKLSWADVLVDRRLDNLEERLKLVEEVEGKACLNLVQEVKEEVDYYRFQARLGGWGNWRYSVKLRYMAYAMAENRGGISKEGGNPFERDDEDVVADVVFASRKDAETFGSEISWVCKKQPVYTMGGGGIMGGGGGIDIGTEYPERVACADAVITKFHGNVLIGNDGAPKKIQMMNDYIFEVFGELRDLAKKADPKKLVSDVDVWNLMGKIASVSSEQDAGRVNGGVNGPVKDTEWVGFLDLLQNVYRTYSNHD